MPSAYRSIHTLILLLAAAPLMGQSTIARQLAAPPLIGASEARAVLAANAPWVHVRHYGGFIPWDSEVVNINSIQIAANELRLDASAKNSVHHLHLALPEGEEFKTFCDGQDCYLCWKSAQKELEFFDENQHGRYKLSFGTNGSGGEIQKRFCARAGKDDVAACEQSPAQFAGALNALRRTPGLANFNADSFHQKAAAWRAQAAMPELSEEARTRRLLAEDAITNNQPEEALRFYDEGVGLDPTWAQGWFNLALVAGQLNLYSDAVLSMRNYLELLPQAADAASVRDQIRVWQYKAQKK